MRNNSRSRAVGFSLVEMVVALAFTMVLMAGMASVFRASLGVFVTSSEKLSSSRRNLMTMDMLYDDLNQAGMLPTSLVTWPPGMLASDPPFVINRTDVDDPGTDWNEADADQLCFYYDDILPFSGHLQTPLPGATPGMALPSTALLEFRDVEQATQVQAGMMLLTRAGLGYPRLIQSPTPQGGGRTEVTFGSLQDIANPSPGGSGGKYTILNGSEVLVARPGRYARYSIQARFLDPEYPAQGIPCLVREEVQYGRPFAATEPSYTAALITENVCRFKVYLSVDGGQQWAGMAAANWTTIVTELNARLATTGRPGFKSITDGSFWFREIPTVVRVDVTTRTVRPRTEYAANPAGGTAVYKEQTQSLVLTPRHFGLPY